MKREGTPSARAVAVVRTTDAADGLARIFAALDLDSFSAIVRRGDRVVVKPNWVSHRNYGDGGIDCLVTSTALLDAILSRLADAKPAQVVLGDAPIQGCDFAELRRVLGLDALVDKHRRAGLNIELVDFRNRVRHAGASIEDRPERRARSIIFDLGRHSLLEAISPSASRFRVTRYNPDRMAAAHRAGTHRYRIAAEILEADVVINVPKLKTHMKAGVTGAIKNLVGINGDKEFLPHHRKGGTALGGDCYEGFSLVRHISEELYDIGNRLEARPQLARFTFAAISALAGFAQRLGAATSVEGSWWGNDTVWRMTLDLHRVLRYGRRDGTFADTPQRTIFTITDAIIGGEGNGPLSPTPVASGFLTAGANPIAVEWINAKLMGFDPARLPIIAEAMRQLSGEMPLVDFRADEIEVCGVQDVKTAATVQPFARTFRPADGWRSHLERAT